MKAESTTALLRAACTFAFAGAGPMTVVVVVAVVAVAAVAADAVAVAAVAAVVVVRYAERRCTPPV